MIALLWIAGLLLFPVATLLFHFFPRTIAGLALIALFLGKSDLGGVLGIFSLDSGEGDMGALILLLAGIVFFWLFLGLLLDARELTDRWNRCWRRCKS